MKQYTMYVCETCKRESRNANVIKECEANHIGLTIEEKFKYDGLKENVKRCSCMIETTKNERTDKEFDNAINELITFEKDHGLIK